MVNTTARSDKIQVSLTRDQAAELYAALAAAGRAAPAAADRAAGHSWCSYLDWRAIRKWGLAWRDAAARRSQAG